jgi:hypothetical protein
MHRDVERTLNITIFQEWLKNKNGFSCFLLSLTLSLRVSLGLVLLCADETALMIAIFVPLASSYCHSLALLP